MFTAKFRECRSVLSDVPLVGSLVKGGRVAFEQSRRSLVVAHTHGASVPSRIEPVAEFADRLQSAPLSRGFSCASDANLRHDGESVRDLFREAQIARLAGYCYDDFTTLTENVEAEGLQIVACGDTFFTRWYCCKGQITGSVPGDNEFDTLSTETNPLETETLHVFFRGVMWRSPEVETVRVWQKLSQSWGVPITTVDNTDSHAISPDTDTESGLMAHSGILEMAQELYMEMRPIFQEHSGPIRIAGHSLGGTLAILVASQLILEDGIDPLRLRLHAFGSPPALSHKSCSVDVSSNCGAAVRQRLGLPAANIRNWVLDFDPVPRATTAANPYLQVARKNEVFRSMYDLAGMAATALGVAHPAQRFFFRHVGSVFMLTHSDPTADSNVRPLDEATADEELAQAPVVGRGEGFRPRAIAGELLRSVLDHTHTSYGHDLLVAAKLALQHHGIDGVVGAAAPVADSSDSRGGSGGSMTPVSSGQQNGPVPNSSARDSSDTQGRIVAPTSYEPQPGPWHRLAADAPIMEMQPLADEQMADGSQAVQAGRLAGVLALASRSIAGVRIRNGVAPPQESKAESALKSTVFAHRRTDWAPLKVAEQLPSTKNTDGANGQIMNEVLPLRVRDKTDMRDVVKQQQAQR